MADKFRTTFTIPVTFAAGEQPTNTKLNSVSTQSRNGLALLERAIGDLWNQGGDATSSAYPNRIVNIARALGDQALLTSKIPLPNFTGTTSVRIRQPIAPFLGKSEILLDFKPTVDATLRASVDGLRYTASLTYAASEVTTPTADDQWAVDAAKGRIKLGAALHSSQPVTYIEYNVAAADFAGSTDSLNASSFSMVPNQTQTDWKGLKICQIAANQYNIVLPFRRPDASPAGLSKLPLNSNNSAEVGSPSTIRYWGPVVDLNLDSTNLGDPDLAAKKLISSNKFYRYTLPQVVLGMFTSPVAGTIIPSGTLYLWDTVTNTIVEGVTFKVPSITPTLGGVTGQQPFILQADGATLDQVFNGPNGDFTSSMTTDKLADYTVASRFALICVGQSLADAVSQLRKDLTEGDAAVGPRKRPSHRDLAETQPAVGARHAVNVPPSFVDGDDHPHLLSRLGSAESATTTAHRDRFNNGILGNLLLLSTSSASNYQNLSAVSNYMYFGSVSSSSPRLRSNPGSFGAAPSGVARNALEINNTSLKVNTGIIGLGFDGYGLAMKDSRDLIVFDDGGDITGRIWGQRLLLRATTQNLSSFNGTINSTRYIDIDTNTVNQIFFKGGQLNLDATSGDGSDVVIGDNNASTQLRLKNNILVFGKSTDVTIPGQARLNRTAGNILSFQTDTDGNGTYQIGGATLRAGALIVTDGIVHFDNDGTTGDVLTFDDANSRFIFKANNSESTSSVQAGSFRAFNGTIHLQQSGSSTGHPALSGRISGSNAVVTFYDIGGPNSRHADIEVRKVFFADNAVDAGIWFGYFEFDNTNKVLDYAGVPIDFNNTELRGVQSIEWEQVRSRWITIPPQFSMYGEGDYSNIDDDAGDPKIYGYAPSHKGIGKLTLDHVIPPSSGPAMLVWMPIPVDLINKRVPFMRLIARRTGTGGSLRPSLTIGKLPATATGDDGPTIVEQQQAGTSIGSSDYNNILFAFDDTSINGRLIDDDDAAWYIGFGFINGGGTNISADTEIYFKAILLNYYEFEV